MKTGAILLIWISTLLAFVGKSTLFASDTSSLHEQVEKAFPLLINAQLDTTGDKLNIALKNNSKHDLILDKQILSSIGITFSYFTQDNQYIDTGFFSVGTDDEPEITPDLVSKELGKRFILLKPQESTMLIRSLHAVFEALNKGLAQVSAKAPVHIQVYAQGVLVGVIKDKIPVVDKSLLTSMLLSNVVRLDSAKVK